MANADSSPAPSALQQLAVVVIVVGVMVLGAICGVLKVQVNNLRAETRAQQLDTTEVLEHAWWVAQYSKSAAVDDANRTDPNWLQGMLDSLARRELRLAPQAIRPVNDSVRIGDTKVVEMTFQVTFDSLTRDQIAQYAQAVQLETPLRLRDMALTARVNQPDQARGKKGEAYRVDRLVFAQRIPAPAE